MAKKTSKNTRNEIMAILRERYVGATKKEKTKMVDEFAAIAQYHRKHAIRLLGDKHKERELKKIIVCKRIYDEATKEALIVTWEAADRICSKRLKALLPELIDSMEYYKHIKLDIELRQRLLRMSSATIDRLLSDVRKKANPKKKKRKTVKRVSGQIPTRTFADWDNPVPGYLEIDFVVHSGGLMAGKFIHTLVATDMCSGWIECIPLLFRDQALVVEALDAMRRQLPFTVLGINSDNDSAFINDTLIEYCKKHNIEFTRSRPFRKNDQAWIEQKNGAVVRRFVGHDRFSGVVAGQALAHLYQLVRFYVNYFQPSFKLQEKERQGAKVKRVYYKPATPCNRLIEHTDVETVIKENLKLQRRQLDPVRLLHQIRDDQAALVALISPDDTTGPGRISLEQFLAQLPSLWQLGDARPTHKKGTSRSRNWRTRKDPFKEVWADILNWLQNEPDVTAKELLNRLRKNDSEKFTDSQLRTLQRRIKEWRKIMAKNLVYSCPDVNIKNVDAIPVGAIA
ncbi:transposase family protein [Candidatus Pacearchaeota archaeon]|nr:transposase family protein [Candidatus Pacearchaeota archaeon]